MKTAIDHSEETIFYAIFLYILLLIIIERCIQTWTNKERRKVHERVHKASNVAFYGSFLIAGP